LGSPAGTDLGRRVGVVQSRIGRRLLVIFIASAIVPVAVMAFWSHRQVRSALIERAQGRLEVAAKEHAVAMVDRGLALADLVRAVETGARARATLDSTRRPRLWQVPRSEAPPITREQEQHLAQGRPLLVFDAAAPGVARLARVDSMSDAWHWAEVPLHRLVGFGVDEETEPHFCVISTADDRVLQCSAGASAAVEDGALGVSPERWLVARRAVFLRYEFAAPDLEVVAMRSRADAVAAAGSLATVFALVAVLSILIVFVTGHLQIRRITAPLERLTAAVRRLHGGDLSVQVPEEGSDEFAGLARSFNTMSASIARQVGVMAALENVDRSALESRDREQVALAALASLERERGVVEGVVIIPGERVGDPTLLVRRGQDVQRIDLPARMYPIHSGDPFSAAECGRSFAGLGVSGAERLAWRIVPLRHDTRVEGILAVGAVEEIPGAGDRAHFFHQVGDRLAMALANRRLVEDLDAFSLGTLTAFARAVDANSSWTAGHSERVTTHAVALGQKIGLPANDLDTLRRGGLLHDIGKIGVPSTILDKPGRLDPDEVRLIQLHPVIGYDILSPIPAMRDVLPITRHHHERMDGRGYPDKLGGTDIPLLARVLAVADVHDALVSDRPYRAGLSSAEALATLRSMAGPHLDPACVHAFIGLQAERGWRAGGAVSPTLAETAGLELVSP
jgi:HD-GYP domain-containing protein (c-di-GMP phosphodiesterase class II)/HAMP domain-containing protein